ncbi:MAG: SHOCT domain-containing protein [Anaerolineales bacterium]|nr:SHOCT domain-containing protein [Anaerolineales bacterium]
MKPIRWIFIVSMVGVVISLGVVAYTMFFGPDKVLIEGRSLQELIASGDIMPVLVILISLLVVGFSMRPFLRIMFPPTIKNGVNGEARVLKVWDTGVSINDNPQVGLLLELTPPGGAPVQVEAKSVVSRLSAANVQPGVVAEVYYDPADLKRLQVKSFQVSEEPPGDIESRLEKLDRLREKGLISLVEYERKREEILKEI